MDKIPTLFMDVDGVLNNFDHNMDSIQEDKLKLLASIYDATECRIVLSSNWRMYPSMLPELNRRLQQIGLVIHSHTPVLITENENSKVLRAKPRFEEIQAWLTEHPETGNFVILDDELDFAHLEKHHVRTIYTVGLTPKLAEEIIKQLNSPTTCQT